MSFLPARSACAALALFALAAPQPAQAQEAPAQPRTLAVPANAAWQHTQTQMILPPRVDGLARGEIRDATAEEEDVAADYRSEDGLVATVYVYKTMTADVPIWFDRALTLILTGPEHGLAADAAAPVAAFAKPGATALSGLRVALDLGGGSGSTALALAPLGSRFMLKVRLSSDRLGAAALSERLTRFLEGLRWPAEAKPGTAVAPVQPCPEPLRLRQARVLRDDMDQVLNNAIGGILAANVDEVEERRPVYCREPGATALYGVYRPGAATDRYVIALGDSGNALYLGETLDLSELLGGGRSGRRRIAMTSMGRDEVGTLPSFNRLPPPEQTIAVAFGNRGPSISVSTDERPER